MTILRKALHRVGTYLFSIQSADATSRHHFGTINFRNARVSSSAPTETEAEQAIDIFLSIQTKRPEDTVLE